MMIILSPGPFLYITVNIHQRFTRMVYVQIHVNITVNPLYLLFYFFFFLHFLHHRPLSVLIYMDFSSFSALVMSVLGGWTIMYWLHSLWKFRVLFIMCYSVALSSLGTYFFTFYNSFLLWIPKRGAVRVRCFRCKIYSFILKECLFSY